MEHDDGASFLAALEPASDTLLIGFAGLQLTKAIPSFHWVGAFEHLAVSKLFVRDLRQVFYHRGIPGAGEDVSGVAEFLRGFVRRHDIRRVLCLGTSAGAYAALLFGHLLAADEVHAFSPLTHLPSRSPAQMVQLALYGNWPLFRVQWALYTDRQMNREFFDLPQTLATGNGRTRYHLYYGTGHDRDTRHSRAMGSVPGAVLHDYDDADHHLVTHLRDSGELARIIEAACARVQGGSAADPPKVDPLTRAEQALG